MVVTQLGIEEQVQSPYYETALTPLTLCPGTQLLVDIEVQTNITPPVALYVKKLMPLRQTLFNLF